jgi:hypothetical protein
VSMLLLAAMVGCIVIAMKAPAATNGKLQQQEMEKLREQEKEPETEIIVNEISGI